MCRRPLGATYHPLRRAGTTRPGAVTSRHLPRHMIHDATIPGAEKNGPLKKERAIFIVATGSDC
jgi:hypothetical protein